MKQYKDLISTVKDVDEKGRVLVAANAIGNTDSDKDISKDGSFDKTLNEHFKRAKWFLNHDSTILLGVPIEGKQNGKYLEILGQLNMKKEKSRDTYEDYKLYAEYGRTLEHSVGVNAIKWEMKNDVRIVSEWKLWEYSTLTGWGANEDTPLRGIKSADKITEGIEWLNLMLKKGNYTDEKFKQIENQLSIIKALLENEPDDSTQKDKIDSPVIETVKSRDWSIITTLINN